MSEIARRTFLQRLGQMGALGVAPFGLNLAAMGEAAAFNNPSGDYKALVCVFLNGGNDQANTIVPIDAYNYSKYAQARSTIALSQGGILPLLPNTALPNGLKLGLHPSCSRLQGLFQQGKLAVLQNVGTLIAPLTLTDYQLRRQPIPPRLFSHSDQQNFWQSTVSDRAARGWGGALGDLALQQNSQSVFTCITTAGQAVFLSGGQSGQYCISNEGAIPIWAAQQNGWIYHSQLAASTLRQLISQPRTHLMEQHINQVAQRSLNAENVVTGALASAGALNTVFNANNDLAAQLGIVARLIKARSSLGVKRQVFMVGISGFDTHDSLFATHGHLLAKIDEALAAFYSATVEMGVAEKVTTFTTSDFGRTLTANGDGSDHGWGSHHFVMGGAVKGKQFYGVAPEIGLNTADDVGQGRLLPSTSVDQYAATLARWFGVSDSEMPLISPNLYRFSQPSLGFMLP